MDETLWMQYVKGQFSEAFRKLLNHEQRLTRQGTAQVEIEARVVHLEQQVVELQAKLTVARDAYMELKKEIANV